MKAVPSRITRPLPVGAKLTVADNSGAKIVELVGVKNYKGVKRRIASAGVGSLIVAAVKSGNPELKGTVVYCVVIRQRKEYRRPDGARVKFNDNAVVLLKDIDEGLPKGTRVKGPVAREAITMWPKIGKISSVVI